MGNFAGNETCCFKSVITIWPLQCAINFSFAGSVIITRNVNVKVVTEEG